MAEDPYSWETSPSRSSLVSIGTHRLYVSVSGPLRQPRNHSLQDEREIPSITSGAGLDFPTTKSWTKNPVVIIFPGAGESFSSWPRVQEGLSLFARTLLYDRTGLGKSDRYAHAFANRSESGAKEEETGKAVAAAKELCKLLEVISISGPYVLVGHSYGAVVAREFLHLRPHEIAGMLLVEGSTERQPEYFPLPNPNITALLGTLKFSEVTGLKANAQLSRDEWKTRAIEISQSFEAVQAEAAAYEEVCRQLGKKQQFKNRILGHRPLSVIKCQSSQDYERIYEAGLDAGNGTDEQRNEFRYLLENWDNWSTELQREQMQLSSHARWVEVPHCGHNVNLIRPDVIVQEVKWVLGWKGSSAGHQL